MHQGPLRVHTGPWRHGEHWVHTEPVVYTAVGACGAPLRVLGYSHEGVLRGGSLLVLHGRVCLRLVLGGRHGLSSPGKGLRGRSANSGGSPDGGGVPGAHTPRRGCDDCQHVLRLSRRRLGARTKHSQLAAEAADWRPRGATTARVEPVGGNNGGREERRGLQLLWCSTGPAVDGVVSVLAGVRRRGAREHCATSRPTSILTCAGSCWPALWPASAPA